MTVLRFSLPVQAALLQGAALALLSSCAGSVTELPDGDDGTTGIGGALNTGGTSATGGERSTGGTSTGEALNLPPAPNTECVGEDHGDGPGFYGVCCSDISCRPPGPDGVCLPPDAGELASLPGYPPGSGSCGCEAMQGPFAPHADASHLGEGECCYSIYSISCDGRPLRREDASLVLAPVVQRADWSQPSALRSHK